MQEVVAYSASDEVFTSTYCKTTQKIKESKSSAQLHMEDQNGKVYNLCAYSDALSTIVTGNIVTVMSLLGMLLLFH